MKESLTFTGVMGNILNAMEELDGEQIADIHNQICSRKIKYDEDSLWEYTGEDDSKGCGVAETLKEWKKV